MGQPEWLKCVTLDVHYGEHTGMSVAIITVITLDVHYGEHAEHVCNLDQGYNRDQG